MSIAAISWLPSIASYLITLIFLPVAFYFLALCLLACWVLAITALALLGGSPRLAPAILGLSLAGALFLAFLAARAVWRFFLRRGRIVFPRDAVDWAAAPRRIGPKAWRLSVAARGGAKTPRGFAVVGGVRRDGEAAHNGALRRLSERVSAEARRMGFKTLILRSSFGVEDDAGHSFAGCFVSIPDVPAADGAAIVRGLQTVRQSYRGEKAVAYRRLLGLPEERRPDLAVLVQEQLSFVLRGQASSFDVASGREDLLRIETEFPCVATATVSQLDQTVHLESAPAGLADLFGQAVPRVAALLQSQAALFNEDVLIEWGVNAADRLFLLQVRPLPAKPAAAVYTNAAVVHLLAHPLTPLSHDVLASGNHLDAVLRSLPGLKSAAPPLIKTVAGRFFLRFGAVRPLLNPYAGASTGGAFALTAWLIRTLLDARRFRRRPPPSPAATPADNPDALCAALQQTVHGRLRPLIRRQTNWTFAAHLLRSWGTELAVGASRAAPGSSAASASDHAAAPLFPLMEAELMLAADEPPASTPTLPAAADRWAFPEDADHNVPARRQLTAWLNAAGGSLEAARDRAKLDILRLNHALHDLANRLGEALKLPPNAAYFHTMAELSALAAGRGGPTADELERRQAEYEANRRSAPGAILLVDEDGAVHAPETPTDGGARRGVAIVSGQASGEAMTLDAASPPPLEAVDAGKILVIPDGRAFWIPYLARAGGAVLAGGSILSHLAVAGRELGVPLVLFPSGFAAADGRRVEIAGGEARADEHG